MAVVKTEIIITQALYHLALRREISKANPHFPSVLVQWHTVRRSTCLIPADVGLHWKRKMAKPEVVLSHVLQQIDMQFERLYPGFQGRSTQWTYRRRRPTPEMQDGGR